MLPLTRIGKNMRTTASIFLQIPVGADGNVFNLWAYRLNNMINQRLVTPQR
jgi:hypothetical protein